jgi:hypothetical protein
LTEHNKYCIIICGVRQSLYGRRLLPSAKGVVLMYVTYENMFAFTAVLISLATLMVTIYNHKKK